jgi:maleate cis-trans isomerase
MYWKARIGSISPSVFEALPHDFYKVAPDRVLQVGVACMVQDWREDEYEKALAKVDVCVRELARRGVQCIHHGGVPLVISRGYGFETELVKRIEKIAKVPASTSVVSLMEALRFLGIKRPVVVDPYPDALHEKFIAYLQRAAFEVAHSESMRMDFTKMYAVDLEDVYQFAEQAFAKAAQADGLCFACPQYPIIDVVAKLEQEIGKPVVPASLAQIWKCLKMVGINDPRPGYGSLIESLR